MAIVDKGKICSDLQLTPDTSGSSQDQCLWGADSSALTASSLPHTPGADNDPVSSRLGSTHHTDTGGPQGEDPVLPLMPPYAPGPSSPLYPHSTPDTGLSLVLVER